MELKILSDEEIENRLNLAEKEYEDVQMTDAEFECKLYQLVAQAQLESCEKQYQELKKKEFNPDYLDFQTGVEAGKTIGKAEGIKTVVELLSTWECKSPEGLDFIAADRGHLWPYVDVLRKMFNLKEHGMEG